MVTGLAQRAFGLGAVGDVAADALHLGGAAGIGANQPLAPCDPSRSERGRDLLVVNPRAVRLKRRVTLFKDIELEVAADQRAARPLGQFAIGVVGKSDAAVGIAQNDQVALRFEQAAGALLGFLQFPVAVSQRFVMQGDLAEFPAHPAQPEAQRRQRHAGERKQEAGADRKCVGVIARTLGPASGDEAIGPAERGGKDHEGADGEDEPGMISGEAAYPYLDPENPPHRQPP